MFSFQFGRLINSLISNHIAGQLKSNFHLVVNFTINGHCQEMNKTFSDFSLETSTTKRLYSFFGYSSRQSKKLGISYHNFYACHQHCVWLCKSSLIANKLKRSQRISMFFFKSSSFQTMFKDFFLWKLYLISPELAKP